MAEREKTKTMILADQFISLGQAGRIAEARKVYDELREWAKYEPDNFIVKNDGTGVAKKGQRIVEQGPDGKWRLKNPGKKSAT